MINLLISYPNDVVSNLRAFPPKLMAIFFSSACLIVGSTLHDKYSHFLCYIQFIAESLSEEEIVGLREKFLNTLAQLQN